MAKVLNGRIANYKQTEEVHRYPLRNYQIPKVSDIQDFVRNYNYELYNLRRIVFLQSYARMLKSRVLYERYVRLYLYHSVLYLQRFYLTLWHFKANRTKKRNYERKQRIYAGMCYLYQQRYHLITIERYIVYRRMLRYFYQIKSRYNYFRRLLRQALSFYKGYYNKVMLTSLRILRSYVAYRNAVQLYLRQQSETSEIDFELLSSCVASRVEHFYQYYAQLLTYYSAAILELVNYIDILMLRDIFYQFRYATTERQERVGRRRTAMQQSNFIELLFFGWKDVACNRHYLLGKYLFLWRRYVNSTESHITKTVHARIKSRCLQKLVIFKNTQLLQAKIDYLAAYKVPTIRFLCAAFSDYCTGASFYANGQFVSNEQLLASLSVEAGNARDDYRKIKFFLLLARYTSQRKVFCRLILLCNVFYHYAQVLLAFKLLSVKVASIKQYRILYMNNKQLFVQQTYNILSDSDLWAIYYLAVSASDINCYERLLENYPYYLRKFAHLVLRFKLYQLNEAVDLWIESSCIFCDVFLFLRVMRVALYRVFVELPRDRDKLVYARTQYYRASMAYNPLQGLNFVRYFVFWDRFAKFYFVRALQRKSSMNGPFNWLLQKQRTNLASDFEEYHGTIFKNNDIIPYAPHLFQQCKMYDMAFDCSTLVESFSLRAAAFHYQVPAFLVSQSEVSFIDRLMQQFNVYEARRPWIIRNCQAYRLKHGEISHSEMMKSAYELVSVGEAELLEAQYECKLVTYRQSQQYVDIYNHRKYTADYNSIQAYKQQEEQLKRLADHLRLQIKQMHAEKQLALKHKFAYRVVKKKFVFHGKKHLPKKKHLIFRKIKKSRKVWKLNYMLTRTIKQFISDDARRNYGSETSVAFSEYQADIARKRVSTGYSEKVGRRQKNKNLYYEALPTDITRRTSGQHKFDFAADSPRADSAIGVSSAYVSRESAFALASKKDNASNSKNIVTAIGKYSAQKLIKGVKLRDAGRIEETLCKTRGNALSKISRTISNQLGDSRNTIDMKTGLNAGQPGITFVIYKASKHDTAKIRKQTSLPRESDQTTMAQPSKTFTKPGQAAVQQSGFQALTESTFSADYCSSSVKISEQRGYLPDSDGPASLKPPVFAISEDAECMKQREVGTFEESLANKIPYYTRANWLAGAAQSEEMTLLLTNFIENTDNFLKGTSCSDKMKNLLTYMVFSELDTDYILDSTPWLTNADKAAFGELFTRSTRKQLLSSVYLNISLPDGRTGRCRDQNGQPWLRPVIKQQNYFYVKQEQVGFPIVVKSFAEVQSTINEISNTVFDISNLKIRQQLRRSVQPVYVRLLKGKMTHWCTNFAKTTQYGTQRPRLHFYNSAFSLPSHGVRYAVYLCGDLTVRFLKGDPLNGISITETDLEDLMAFEWDDDGSNARYGATRGPGNRDQ